MVSAGFAQVPPEWILISYFSGTLRIQRLVLPKRNGPVLAALSPEGLAFWVPSQASRSGGPNDMSMMLKRAHAHA